MNVTYRDIVQYLNDNPEKLDQDVVIKIGEDEEYYSSSKMSVVLEECGVDEGQLYLEIKVTDTDDEDCEDEEICEECGTPYSQWELSDGEYTCPTCGNVVDAD